MSTPQKTTNAATAFPDTVSVEQLRGKTIIQPITSGGMSLRDWFAGQALAAYLAGRNRDSRDTATPNTAASCYAYADAMLAARNKEVAP